jgi:CcmD family protein
MTIRDVSGVVLEVPGGDATTKTPDQRATGFHAVEGAPEMASGGTLLVEAYAAVWVIVLGFLLVSWRRQARLDARVADLEKRLADHQQRG